MLEIRRSRDRLVFNMGIPIHGKDGHYIDMGPEVGEWEIKRVTPLRGTGFCVCTVPMMGFGFVMR